MITGTTTGAYKGYSSIFKAKVALLALDAKEDLSHLAARFDLNEALIRCWKEELLENLKHEVQSPPEKDYVDPRAVYTHDLESFRDYSQTMVIANENRPARSGGQKGLPSSNLLTL